MAKAKNVVKYFDVPKKLNDGLRIADVKKKVGDESNCVFRIIVCDHNAEGVRAIVAHLSDIGLDGPAVVAQVVNTAIATGSANQADPKDLGKTLGMVPRIPKFGEVDKAAVAAQRTYDFVVEHKRAPTAEENVKLYAGLAL